MVPNPLGLRDLPLLNKRFDDLTRVVERAVRAVPLPPQPANPGEQARSWRAAIGGALQKRPLAVNRLTASYGDMQSPRDARLESGL